MREPVRPGSPVAVTVVHSGKVLAPEGWNHGTAKPLLLPFPGGGGRALSGSRRPRHSFSLLRTIHTQRAESGGGCPPLRRAVSVHAGAVEDTPKASQRDCFRLGCPPGAEGQ